MFVAVYGYGYWVVATDLRRYPQLVVIAFLGKTLTPIGWIHAVLTGAIPARTLWVNVFNDLIWLPFFVAYFSWYKRSVSDPPEAKQHRPLYQRLLREDFEKLPAVLRRFHSSETGGNGQGLFRVAYAEGVLRRLVARLLGVPSPSENVPVRLQVIADGSKEVWIRQFDGKTRRTVQWQQGDCLMEKAGPLEFAFRLSGHHAGMRFQFVRCRLFKVPLPESLAPHVEAEVEGFEDFWKVEVRISSPLLGPVASYTGSVAPTP